MPMLVAGALQKPATRASPRILLSLRLTWGSCEKSVDQVATVNLLGMMHFLNERFLLISHSNCVLV